MVHTVAMTIINRFALFLSFSLFLASCKTDNKQITSDMIHFPPSGGGQADNAPVITFDSSTCNFGTLAIGEKFPHTFRFTNTGKSALIISNATATCGCTVPEYPKQPLAPGKTGIIHVVFNSTGKSGMQNKIITLTTNTFKGNEELHLVGNVKPKNK